MGISIKKQAAGIAVFFILMLGSAVFYYTGCSSISCVAEKFSSTGYGIATKNSTPTETDNKAIASLDTAVPAVKSVSAPAPLKIIQDIVSGEASDLTQTGIIAQTNHERTARGLPALSENQKLDAAATVKVNDMFAKQYFEHISPSGVGPDGLAERVGYAYIIVGENLALGNFADDQALLNAWMNSPGHRANILNARFEEIGAAVKQGMFEGREVWLAVQEFGRPRSSCPSIDPSLKQMIQNSKAQIESLQTSMDALRQEIDAMEPKWGNAYNQKVDEYNALIPSYNQLIEATKMLIDRYNNQVRLFNNCIAN
jgi:uncharacterized protein YkwD